MEFLQTDKITFTKTKIQVPIGRFNPPPSQYTSASSNILFLCCQKLISEVNTYYQGLFQIKAETYCSSYGWMGVQTLWNRVTVNELQAMEKN